MALYRKQDHGHITGVIRLSFLKPNSDIFLISKINLKTFFFHADEEDFESMYETSRSNEDDLLMDELYEESLLSHKRRSYFFMVLLGLVMGVLVLFYCGGFAFCVRNIMGAMQNSAQWCRSRRGSGPRYSPLPNMHKLA